MTSFDFREIPEGIRKPGAYMEFNTNAANRLLPNNSQKILLIGQKHPDAQQAVLTVFDVYSADQVGISCGFGSLAHRMAKAGIKAFPYASVQMILLDDSDWPAAAEADVVLAFAEETTTAISSGKVNLKIGGDSYVIAVAQNDSASTILTKVMAAVNNDNDSPVTAAYESGNTLTLTLETAGLVAESLPLSIRCDVANITLTVPATPDVTALTHPTADDMQSVLDIIFAAGHNILVIPYLQDDVLTAVRDHLDLVSNGVEQRGVTAIYASGGAIADVKTRIEDLNPKRIVGGYLRGQTNWSPEIAAALAFVLASESDPARPLNGLPLLGIAAPDVGDWLSRTEQEDLLHNGITPLEVGAGKKVLIVRMISGYTVNDIGVPDPSLLDITTIRSLDYTRRSCRERILLRFPRVKNSASRRRAIRSELLQVLKQLEELEIVQNVETNKDMLVVLEDATDRTRANSRIPADIVRGLHVLAAEIDLL